MSGYPVAGASVLITGGTGSFGKAFVERLMEAAPTNRPRRIIVFSRDELKQHDMAQRWPDTGDSPMRYFLGDVRNVTRLKRAFAGVDYVVHAAALKQVPACEYNPVEAVETNISGALNVIEAALAAGVKKVVALSTDKAVHPVNLYGASKLVAEKLFVQANSYRGTAGTRFAVTRYGNVAGSRGSVIPVFAAARAAGEPLPITDPAMTRFWMTLGQAVDLVLHALTRCRGGEILVPKVTSTTIMELARAMSPAGPFRVTGIRPGEKLHETLITDEEVPRTLDAGDLYVIQPRHPWWTVEGWEGAMPVPADFCYRSDTTLAPLPWSEQP